MPTPEELKYFVALRDVIAGKMGEWQSGDRYFCPNDKRGDGYKVKFIEDGYFDSMQYDSEHKLGAWVIPEPCCPDVVIRLPLPIDPENPERGLVGMIKHFEWLIVNPKSLDWSCGASKKDDPQELEVFSAPTPTLALLKTLAWQEGIEVK